MLKRTALLICLGIAACVSSAALAAPLPQPTGWVAVLIAGDDQEPAFANAVDAMADKLESEGVDPKRITVLKAEASGAAAATRSNIRRIFADLTPAEGEGCFAEGGFLVYVYFTIDDGTSEEPEFVVINEPSAPESDGTFSVTATIPLDATPGDHVISVRATDGDGEVQTDERTPPAPDGARGHHTIQVSVS